MSDKSAQIAPSPGELLTIPLADLTKLGGFETAREIAQQPALWRKTWKMVLGKADQIKHFLDKAYGTDDLEVIFADEKDELINELGVKGVGEIGLIAMPAAIVNAIFHATGKRINNLPIHFDELM